MCVFYLTQQHFTQLKYDRTTDISATDFQCFLGYQAMNPVLELSNLVEFMLDLRVLYNG